MIAIVSPQSSMMTQLSLNSKQQLSKLPKTDERPLIPGIHLIMANIYKIIIIANDVLNPVHPIVVAQAKPQSKDRM